MSRWPDKYVIGLTGNIATGKSLIRKMLEHLGAFGIDADGLTAQAMSKGAPAYQPIVETFGKWLLTDSEDINRESLGRVVFSDPSALAKLEAIVHPIVGVAIDTLVKRASQKVVVIEAIKLIESGMAADCDAVWVVDAPEDVQLSRLTAKRGMSEVDARQRIAAQAPQKDKLASADVVIQNTGSFEEPWAEVQKAWAAITGAPAPPEPEKPEEKEEPVKAEAEPVEPAETPAPAEAPTQVAMPRPEISLDDLSIERGGPGDAQRIADFVNSVNGGGQDLTRDDVMMAFGQKAYFLAVSGEMVIGLAGWQVENLITSVDEFYLRDDVPTPRVIAMLIERIEQASSELQSEVSFMFLPTDMAQDTLQLFVDAGYEPTEVGDLKVAIWREAAAQLMPDGTRMLSKRLREDRVLKPI